jgi:hypothetical protein
LWWAGRNHRFAGHVVDRKILENAPSYDMEEDFLWTPEYGRRVDKYYNAPSYW